MYSLTSNFFLAQFALLCCLIVSSTANASDKDFTDIGSPFVRLAEVDGHSLSNINTIVQDREGFIWFANNKGLMRYDGNHVKTYAALEPVANSTIDRIIDAGRGRILFGAGLQGLAYFDKNTEQLVRVPIKHMLPKAWTEAQVLPRIGQLIHRGQKVYVAIKDRVLILNDADFSLIDVLTVPIAEDDLLIRLLITSSGTMWAASSNGLGAMRYDGSNWQSYPHNNADNTSISANYIIDMYEDSRQQLWFASYSGLNLFDPTSDSFTRYYPRDPSIPENISENILVSIKEDQQGRLWTAVYGKGLYQFTQSDGRFHHIPSLANLATSNISNSIVASNSALFLDNNDTLWVSTNAGVAQLTKNSRGLTQWTTAKQSPCTAKSAYRSKHGLLFGCNGQLIKQNKDNFEVLIEFKDRIMSMVDGQKDEIWIALNGGGIARLHPVSGKVQTYQFTTEKFNPLAVNSIWYINVHDSGEVYALQGQHPNKANGAILQYNAETDSFNPIPIGIKSPFYLEFDQQHLLLVGAYTPATQNLFLYNKESSEISPLPLETNTVFAIAKWRNSIIASTANQGLIQINSSAGDFSSIVLPEGAKVTGMYQANGSDRLYLDIANDIFELKDGQTQPQLECITCALPNHLPKLNNEAAGQIFETHSYISADDTLHVFDAEHILAVPFNSFARSRPSNPLLLTDFKMMEQSQPLAQLHQQGILENSFSKTNMVTIPPQTSLLSFTFSRLLPLSSGDIEYAYKLIGLNQDWIHLPEGESKAVFSLLPAGDYKLLVKSTDGLGNWQSDQLQLAIRVQPPLWQTWWAYLFYIIAFSAVLLAFAGMYYRQQMMAAEQKAGIQLAKTKDRLLANLSHEFKTPLTLILGPAHEIEEQSADQELKVQAELISKNAKTLMAMVEQMLHLARLKEYQQDVLIKQNVSDILQQSLAQFRRRAMDKHIQFNAPEYIASQWWVEGTEGAVRAIVDNLLSNAVKFTESNGQITVQTKVNNEGLLIEISDTGSGIAPDSLQGIFDRFVRLEQHKFIPGTGIGLALVKELTESMRGRIWVESTEGKGSCFKLQLPLLKDQQQSAKQAETNTNSEASKLQSTAHTPINTAPSSTIQTAASDKPTLLVVEDNRDLRQFILGCLESQYTLIEAENGKAALSLALKHSPDLIISDIVMPEMDGFELLDSVRNNMAISHIPVILLTAKGDQGSRLKGLSEMADDYVCKPFHPQELKLRVSNLIGIRALVRQSLSQQFNAPALNTRPEQNEDLLNSQPTLTEKDLAFIELLNNLLAQTYSDTDTNLPSLAKQVAMSERQLQRKLKALLGVTFRELLRDYRLQQAELMLTKGMRVSAVADAVGFSSSSYFTRCFKAKFGCPPNEYQNVS